MNRLRPTLNRGYSLLTIAIILVLIGVFMAIVIPPSPTDAQRESSSVVTDPKTGCQYIMANRGVTARMDENGKHICK